MDGSFAPGRGTLISSSVDTASTVGKRTLVEQHVAGGPSGLTGLDDLLLPWNLVRSWVDMVAQAPNAERGAFLARTIAASYGTQFQDGNRPDHWLSKLLLAVNALVAGDEGQRGELEALGSYMPASERDYVRARAHKHVEKVRPRSATDDRLDAAQKIVHSLYVLKRAFDESSGFHVAPDLFPDSITPEAARILVQRLPRLEHEVILARHTRNDEPVQRMLKEDPFPWLLEKWGDGAKLAAHIRAEHKRGMFQLEITGMVAETIGGPIWGTLFGSIVEVVKYASSEQSAAEMIANITLKVLTPGIERATGGLSIKRAFLSALIGGITSLIQSEAKILSTDDAEERKRMRANELQKAICDAFVSAVTSRIKLLNSNMPEDEKRELVGKVLEIATKLGIEAPLKPELDRFLEQKQER